MLARVDGVGSDRLRSAVLHQLRSLLLVVEGPDHRILATNQAYLDLLGGFNPVGLPLAEVFGGAEGQGITELYDRALDGKVTTGNQTRFAIVTPGGTEEEIYLDFEVWPLRDAQDHVVGAIATGRDITADVERDRAEAAATAELARRFQRATDVIEAVQRALLPSKLPVFPTLDVSASYVVGGVEQAAGGDWFDVVPRPGGSVAAVVGDVVGHGV
ncbi:MAG: PAS domain-containing protein, partial [Actinobacteria bacterium]|nr:PAS domain-containing protein [Actinomycetota bacterium]